MVVLSAAILSNKRVLVARQFVEMTRLRVEGLLSAFSRLIDKGDSDHTYIETESVRYVYQHMEDLYLLIITNKQSNILEDLETLRLLSQLIQDVCVLKATEAAILENTFDIIFIFDELISFGFREAVTAANVKTYIEMDSHEERIHDVIQKGKEKDEKERRKKIAASLDRTRAKKRESASSGQGESYSEAHAIDITPVTRSVEILDTRNANELKLSGMKLGVQKPMRDLIQQLKPEDEHSPLQFEETLTTVMPRKDPAQSADVHITIDENMTMSQNLDGDISSMTLKGCMSVGTAEFGKCEFAGIRLSSLDDRFRFSLHPCLDKMLFSDNILETKDVAGPSLIGQSKPFLRWSLKERFESVIPFSISCWPSRGDVGSQVVIEIELLQRKQTLYPIKIEIACSSQPKVDACSMGFFDYVQSNLVWNLDALNFSCSSASIEFHHDSPSFTFLPVTIDATLSHPICDIQIDSAYDQKSKMPAIYDKKNSSIFHVTVVS